MIPYGEGIWLYRPLTPYGLKGLFTVAYGKHTGITSHSKKLSG